ELHGPEQRAEAVAVLRLAGDRDRPDRAAVKAAVRRDHRGAVRCAGDDRLVATRELERALVGFGARTAEEHALGTATICDRPGREDLLIVVVEVRDVHELAELLRHPRGERR